MDTVPTEGASVSKGVQALGDVNGVSVIPHDKMRSLDNLVSLIDDANDKIDVLWDPWESYHGRSYSTNLAIGFALAVASPIMSASLESFYAFGLLPVGLALAFSSAFVSKSHDYDHPTNVFNFVPRLLWGKSFRKSQKESLELEAKLDKEEDDYEAVVEVAKSKIVALLDEVNGEMDLGTSFLSYDSENNKLELSSKHEYKSLALRQAVLSGELTERKQITD